MKKAQKLDDIQLQPFTYRLDSLPVRDHYLVQFLQFSPEDRDGFNKMATVLGLQVTNKLVRP